MNKNSPLKTLNYKRDKLNEYKQLLVDIIDKYTYFPKDIAILINFSSHDNKKISSSLKLAMNIFDNLTTSVDRFCIFSYAENIDTLINLTFKNINTVDFVKSQIENYLNLENFDEINQGQMKSNLIKSLFSILDYLDKKNFYSDKIREKWFIVLTDEFSDDDIDYFKRNEIKIETLK